MIDLVVVGIDMFLAVIHFYFFDIDISFLAVIHLTCFL